MAIVAVLAALGGPARAESVLDRIQRPGEVLKIGFGESPPFSFLATDGTVAGYSVEVCGIVLEQLKKRLQLPALKVTWTSIDLDKRVDAVAKGEIDLYCGGLTDTHAREELVDFSQIIYAGGGAIAVAADSPIESLDHLNRKRIGIVAGVAQSDQLKDWVRDRQFEVEWVTVKDHYDGIEMLARHELEAYGADRATLATAAKTLRDPTAVRIIPGSYSYDPIALAMRHGDPRFRLAINRELSAYFRTKTAREKVERWLLHLTTVDQDRVLASMFVLSTRPE